MFVEQTHILSRRVYMFFEQIKQIFQESLSNRHVFSRTVCLLIEQTLLSYRTETHFSRKPYLVLEQIIFQGTEQMGIVQKDNPRRTDISAIGLGAFVLVLIHVRYHIQPRNRETPTPQY